MMKDASQSSSADLSAGGPEWDRQTRMEHDKRLRREIAESNERRRIQSVNAGFQSLITLLPHQQQEKMTKIVVDPNAFDDIVEAPEPEVEHAPPYNLHIPPRAKGVKHKKPKNRRRHSETIWTIVSEQENHHHPHFATTTKPSKSGKHKSKSTGSSPKKDKEAGDKSQGDKKSKSKKKQSKEHTVSFLDNPIFDTELKNWTLPRVELWCKDPQCQINVQLWSDYCQSHQSELTQLQVQELLHHQHQYVHQQQQQQQLHRCNHQHHHQPPPPPPLPQQHSRFLSDTALPPDLPAPSTLSRRQRLSTISHIFDDTDGATTNSHRSEGYQQHLQNPGCSHPYHHQQSEEEEHYYSHQYGNMHINMSIGASMNNLSGHPPHSHPHHQDSGVGTPSPTSPKNNNVIPTAIPQSSGGGSSDKTASTTVGSSSSSSGAGGSHAKSSSSRGENGKINGERGSYSDSSSSSTSSSSSSSSGDVSSGSTFVTGFDSSESRGSSVPSSLNKPPHPSLMEPSNNNSNSKTNTNHHHHRSSKSYGDNENARQTTVATTAASGYPSVPYIPSGYRKPGICPSCNGLVPTPSATTNHHLIPVDPILSAAGLGGPNDATLGGIPHHHHTTSSHQYHHNITSTANNANIKSDNAFWNFSKFQHPLQRDHSFHSVGGFTLNGQYNTQVKKRRMVRFCSSHKIALVVSTFSLMVTIGLIVTLILMKKRGMMDTMDMMPT